MGGRAASAPLTRRGESGKTTIADVDLNQLAEGTGRMPHLEYRNSAELDAAFPSLSVPSDVGDDHEPLWDSWDKILLRGQEIIQEIQDRMTSEGRRRCEE